MFVTKHVFFLVCLSWIFLAGRYLAFELILDRLMLVECQLSLTMIMHFLRKVNFRLWCSLCRQMLANTCAYVSNSVISFVHWLYCRSHLCLCALDCVSKLRRTLLPRISKNISQSRYCHHWGLARRKTLVDGLNATCIFCKEEEPNVFQMKMMTVIVVVIYLACLST